MTILSDKAILREFKAGNIIIEPFNKNNLNNSSFDVCLGSNYYIEHKIDNADMIFNPYDEKHVKKVWGEPLKAMKVKDYYAQCLEKNKDNKDYKLEEFVNISPEDEVIFIKPMSTILAHTQEFIGAKGSITTMMKTRSSMGRVGVSSCKCSGFGDSGYCNIWTMEITNHNQYHTLTLLVGRRIAQIVFMNTEETSGKSYSNLSGKYQTSDDFEKLKRDWTPEQCLPKLYLDREIIKKSELVEDDKSNHDKDDKSIFKKDDKDDIEKEFKEIIKDGILENAKIAKYSIPI